MKNMLWKDMKESEYEIYFTLCSGAVFRKLLKLQDIIFRFMSDGAFGEMGGAKDGFYQPVPFNGGACPDAGFRA